MNDKHMKRGGNP